MMFGGGELLHPNNLVLSYNWTLKVQKYHIWTYSSKIVSEAKFIWIILPSKTTYKLYTSIWLSKIRNSSNLLHEKCHWLNIQSSPNYESMDHVVNCMYMYTRTKNNKQSTALGTPCTQACDWETCRRLEAR